MSKSAARSLALLVCLASLSLRAAAQDDASVAALRDRFVDAYRNAALGAPPDDSEAALADYVLYPYIEAARIGRALDGAADAAADDTAEAFIARHAGEPVARAVQATWLGSLADRNELEALVAHYEPDVAGIGLDCRYLAARIELDLLEGVAGQVLARWLTGSQLPPECEPVFAWGRAAGLIDEAAIAERIRLLLENGQPAFARVIARRLPAMRAEPLLRWADLIEDPAAGFSALIENPERSPGDAAVLDAWSRFARDSPGDALARIDALLAALRPGRPQASKLRRAIALGLAWDRRSESLGYFSAVDARDMDDYAREWQVRAALWAGEWPTAADALDALSADARRESAWRYWTARARHALDSRPPEGAYAAIVGDDNFYAALASARLGRPHQPAHQPLELPAADVDAVAGIPAIVRARELHAVGMQPEARREWNFAYADLPPALRRASIALAAGWGWYEIAVLTATRNDVFFDYELLYPLRYSEHIPAVADLTAFDRGLLYGLIRQESLFAPAAVSSAGAIGLTQLRLETARRAAARWQLERPSRSALFDPATNITLGAAQLRNLIDEFDGQVLPGLAGYNAGYNAAARWLPADEIDADVWVENIPFNETRAYVRRVLWHSLVYDWLETRRPQDVSRWLDPIRRP